MMFGWIIGLILIVVLVVALGRRSLFNRNIDRPVAGDANQSALDTLEQRYARGEIDKAEFEEKKAELTA